MLEVTYINGKKDIFPSANDFNNVEDYEGVIKIVKHQYDEDNEFDEDDDKTLAYIWEQQIRKIEITDTEEKK